MNCGKTTKFQELLVRLAIPPYKGVEIINTAVLIFNVKNSRIPKMQNGKLTYCDAENAVENGSYKTASDDDLREMLASCMGVSGPNHSAVQRIHKVGDEIRAELSKRESREKQIASLPTTFAIPNAIQNRKNDGANSTEKKWDETRLAALISDRAEETLTLEFKAALALSRDSRKTAEISKDVSAMANSAGGLIIYGLAEFNDPQRKHLAERIDPIDRTSFSKEWLEHIIGQIRPRIANLTIHPVQLSSGLNDVAYVVEIPKGFTAHQANDGRYYRRYNFESVFMVDHEIRDVMNRPAHPRIFVGANLHVWPKPGKNGICGRVIFDIHNESDVFARHILLVVIAPFRVDGKLVKYEESMEEETDEGSGYKLVFSNLDAPPLFPRMRLSPCFDFRFGNFQTSRTVRELTVFKFLAFADSMPVQMGEFSAEDIRRK